ncbi:C-type lectin domain family 12 member B-like isoform X2 [Sander lucioperca]|uniref:C-type lectin domain family 12 member B-like isoform X2 n=1 Tax=Sander lucioperca TaxID=283035 RepID=UPI0016535FA4|nr:C-type lectin domain family 12 member B-like isoform X2 [Sander lucioperca]
MNRNPQEEIEEMEEEAAANYVIAPACTVEKVAARPDQRFLCFSQYFLPIAVCWLILLVIMGLRIYFATLSHGSDVSEPMAANCNLTNLNDKLRVLENQITDLTAVNQNISRAQWSIDEYCPKVNNERQCRACQKGWRLFQSSCYLINDADQKTWEEAREDCRGRSSDLAVIHDEDDEDELRYFRQSIYWYWIGLRAEGGRWKWINGSDLTER